MTRDGLKNIPGWSGYAATPDGTIWSFKKDASNPRALQCNVDRDGYPRVTLSGVAGCKRFKVHRLIAWTFVGPCPEDCDQVRHLNGVRTDNRAENLAWGNAASNAADREAHGRAVKMTPERRELLSRLQRRYQATKTPEQRSDRIRRSWITRKLTERPMADVLFTPGPWTARKNFVYVENKGTIASVPNPWNDAAQRQANTHLIASAPELYGALVYLAGLYQSVTQNILGLSLEEVNEHLDKVDAALAKARGEQP